ncbi:hypothetical protein [Erythrobacter sp. F6033]|uniref:hypothetical protein n=1 Tax=Erythrobacter sp. F6033 TaxID=2926401 RepID=UPI001FF573A5|nr:hypothetical protein [Erythrobacter sp. F6033]MCK0128608.1 hypothetical protein [Erythrobacter sp. F6033]
MSIIPKADDVPKGKERQSAAFTLFGVCFWTLTGLFDLFDGAIEIKGSLESMTMDSHPLAFPFVWTAIVLIEVWIILAFVASVRAWLRR